jgi:hypothetical protein
MVSKKTLPVVAVLLLLAGAIAVGMGARQEQGIRVPPGALVSSPNAKATGKGPQPTTPQAPQLPAADAQVGFLDDFSKVGLNGWTVANETDSPASWVAVDGRLEIRGDQNGNPSGEPSVLVNRGTTLGNGTFQVHVYPTAGEPVGVVFRGSDKGFYRLDLMPNLGSTTHSRAVLNRVDGSGKGEKIAESASYKGYEYSKWQLVTVTVNGSSIVARVDGRTVLEATDSAFSSGWTGVWTVTGYGAQFDNARLMQSR